LPFSGCFTVREEISYAVKVSVADEIPKHVIASTGKYQPPTQKDSHKTLLVKGFYMPVVMVGQLVDTFSQMHDDIGAGAALADRTLRLYENQAKLVVHWKSNDQPLELSYQVPQDIKMMTTYRPNTASADGGSSGGAQTYISKCQFSRDALVRVAYSEVSQFKQTLNDVQDFITHLNAVMLLR